VCGELAAKAGENDNLTRRADGVYYFMNETFKKQAD